MLKRHDGFNPSNLCYDPVSITVAVIGGAATIGASAITAQSAKKAKEKEVRFQQETLAVERERQEKEAKAQQQVLAADQKLAEKQLALQASRQKFETLATLKTLDNQKNIVINPSPQPVRRDSFVTSINRFIGGLFGG